MPPNANVQLVSGVSRLDTTLFFHRSSALRVFQNSEPCQSAGMAGGRRAPPLDARSATSRRSVGGGFCARSAAPASGGDELQRPCAHVSRSPQALPHAPQFFALLSSAAHREPHKVTPALHVPSPRAGCPS